MEEWRDIPGYEGRYQASDQGRVRSLDHRIFMVSKAGRPMSRLVHSCVLRPVLNRGGYPRCCLGRNVTKLVHRLVLLAFIGPPPEGHEALHLNHTPGDSRLCNLKWGTHSENIHMDFVAGTRNVQGEAAPRVRLTAEKVRGILSSALSQRETARAFGTSRRNVRMIQARQRWAHL